MKGTERAALLLMTLGEQEAAEVLKYMGAKEVQKLGTAMASLSNVTRDEAGNVLDVFITDVEEQTAFGANAEGYVRKLLSNAIGAGTRVRCPASDVTRCLGQQPDRFGRIHWQLS